MTRIMAIEFALDITVNCIAPALIRTRILERLDPEMVEHHRNRTLLRAASASRKTWPPRQRSWRATTPRS